VLPDWLHSETGSWGRPCRIQALPDRKFQPQSWKPTEPYSSPLAPSAQVRIFATSCMIDDRRFVFDFPKVLLMRIRPGGAAAHCRNPWCVVLPDILEQVYPVGHLMPVVYILLVFRLIPRYLVSSNLPDVAGIMQKSSSSFSLVWS
jgi:hypothetical protein